MHEDAQVIPLLPKEGLGVVGRDADAGVYHPPTPSPAEQGSHSFGGKETQERPARDGKRRENAKKMLNLEGTISISPLESTKVSKNKLKTNPKQTQNRLVLRANKLKKDPKNYSDGRSQKAF
jgi:hypothetical protein